MVINTWAKLKIRFFHKKRDVITLKDDVITLKDDVITLKNDVITPIYDLKKLGSDRIFLFYKPSLKS